MKFLEVKKYGKLLQQMPYFKFDFELVVFDTLVFYLNEYFVELNKGKFNSFKKRLFNNF